MAHARSARQQDDPLPEILISVDVETAGLIRDKVLDQVWPLISTLDNATQPGSAVPIAAVQAQADAPVLDVIQAKATP